MRMEIAERMAGCWIDFYEGPCFDGRLTRLFGPGLFATSAAQDSLPGSLITGPRALLLDVNQRVLVQPNHIIPDLRDSPWLADLTTVEIRHILRATGVPR